MISGFIVKGIVSLGKHWINTDSKNKHSKMSHEKYLQRDRNTHEETMWKHQEKYNVKILLIRGILKILILVVTIGGIKWTIDNYYKHKEKVNETLAVEQNQNIQSSLEKYLGEERDQIIIFKGKRVYVDEEGNIKE